MFKIILNIKKIAHVYKSKKIFNWLKHKHGCCDVIRLYTQTMYNVIERRLVCTLASQK